MYLNSTEIYLVETMYPPPDTCGLRLREEKNDTNKQTKEYKKQLLRAIKQKVPENKSRCWSSLGLWHSEMALGLGESGKQPTAKMLAQMPYYCLVQTYILKS